MMCNTSKQNKSIVLFGLELFGVLVLVIFSVHVHTWAYGSF